MFKWFCLGVAVVFLVVVGWMINDIRLQVRQSAEVVDAASQNINEHLPTIVQKTRKMTDALSKNLPPMVEHAAKAAEELAELSADIRQLKELAGVTNTVRDQNLVAYANSLLKKVETSGGEIGVKKTFSQGLKNTRPAAEWAVGARKEALFLSLLVKSKKEMLTRLAKTKFGGHWYMQMPDKAPVTLLDWLKQNHPESRDL